MTMMPTFERLQGVAVIGNIFNVFSRRRENESKPKKQLTQQFRQRTLMLIRDVGPGMVETLEFLHDRLSYLLGTQNLSEKNNLSYADEAFEFLKSCSDPHFFDAIEYLIHCDGWRYLGGHHELVIDRLNEFLNVDDLPYFVTKPLWETREEIYRGTSTQFTGIREQAKIIPKESQAIHNTAIEPALQLLRQPEFLNANSEFMAALEDFRQGKFGDCVTKSNSCYESVMKVICGQKGFGYAQGDTTSKLIRTIMQKTEMDTFWEQPLMTVGTLRNKLSTSHGAGEVQKVVPEHVAKFTLNITASAIVFLYDQAYRTNL
ncbi:abortive infection family protein [Pseudomonas canadensis]|uniref:abortive infection family protein n=1 Tax=Pseudomonas canadensis TaxID=915099 RepID=UPI002734B6B9|nr:abortive infection family protein [Pseudomonas canadensis]WLH27432.1 abortive infection family protein [Pseudomonas canadensis]